MGWKAPVDTVREAVGALNDGNVDGYLGYFDSESRRWVSGLAQPLTLSEISDNLSTLCAAFDDLHLTEVLLFGDERFVCARWRMIGRHSGDFLGMAPSGREIDVDTCEIYELNDDLVVTTWTYGDVEQLFRQITVETDLR